MPPPTKRKAESGKSMKIEHAGNIIRREMMRCGYTLETLSEESDISKAVLQGILTERASTISTRSLCALARAFDYGAADFIDMLTMETIHN